MIIKTAKMCDKYTCKNLEKMDGERKRLTAKNTHRQSELENNFLSFLQLVHRELEGGV